MADKLIVKGLGRQFDGEYVANLRDMVIPGSPQSLDGEEQEIVRLLCDVRQSNMWEELAALNGMLYLALASVVLARLGKQIPEDRLKKVRPVITIQGNEAHDFSELIAAKLPFFEFSMEVATTDEEAEDDESPPAEPAETPENETESPSGGKSSEQILVNQGNGQSLTGRPGSGTSATYDLLTSGT